MTNAPADMLMLCSSFQIPRVPNEGNQWFEKKTTTTFQSTTAQQRGCMRLAWRYSITLIVEVV
eukprot:scaffold3036_cov117-Cylindrotheca_fusiformis.AAC.10